MKKEKYHIRVNGKFQYDLEPDHAEQLDVVSIDGRHFHILKDNRTFKAELLNFDLTNRKCQVKVNGTFFDVAIEDSFDKLIDDLGFSRSVIHKIKTVKAPMPGLVLSIDIQAGQEVVQGDPLMILEAMKMENVIKSPGVGKIKKIVATVGKAVDKGEVLIELE